MKYSELKFKDINYRCGFSIEGIAIDSKNDIADYVLHRCTQRSFIFGPFDVYFTENSHIVFADITINFKSDASPALFVWCTACAPLEVCCGCSSVDMRLSSKGCRYASLRLLAPPITYTVRPSRPAPDRVCRMYACRFRPGQAVGLISWCVKMRFMGTR